MNLYNLDSVWPWLSEYAERHAKPFEPNEILAEVYIRLQERLDDGQEVHNPQAWLKVVFWRVRADCFRKMYRSPSSSLGQAKELPARSCETSPLQKLIADEVAEIWKTRLSPTLAETVVQMKISSSREEACNVLGISKSTLAQRLCRAHKVVRAMLN